MRLSLKELRVGDKVRAAFESKNAYFHYIGEVVSINLYTVKLRTFDGYISVPNTCRIFNDEPAPVYFLTKEDA